jgi:hypothetical protein
MLNLFIWIYSGGGGREVHETFKGVRSYKKVWDLRCSGMAFEPSFFRQVIEMLQRAMARTRTCTENDNIILTSHIKQVQ